MMPLFWIAAAFITGIILEKFIPIPIWGWVGLSLFGLFALGIFHKANWYSR
jgi:hypothetical protein